MRVRLVDYNPEAEKLIAVSARVCYSARNFTDINENMSSKEVVRAIEDLQRSGHLSVFEHSKVTFSVEGVSRALTHQLVRHRHLSFSQSSQRYINLDKFSENELSECFVTPDSISNNAVAQEVYENALKEIQKAYTTMIELGIPEEDSRYIYPNATHSNIVVTGNLRTFMEFLEKRLCNRAQEEIREMAVLMLVELKSVYPAIFNKIGPKCLLGKCPEGSRSCGKQTEVREYFNNL